MKTRFTNRFIGLMLAFAFLVLFGCGGSGTQDVAPDIGGTTTDQLATASEEILDVLDPEWLEKGEPVPPGVNATITSEVYDITTYGTTRENITNVPLGTSKAVFLANLVKGDPAQIWADSGVDDPVVYNDTLVVIAADGTEVIYGIAVDKGDGRTTITSSVYTISNTGASPETITNVPHGTLKYEFIANLIKGDPNQFFADSGLDDPVISGNTIVVIAQDGTEVIYRLYPLAGPGDTVSYWKFDEGSGSVADDSVGTNDGVVASGVSWVTGHNGVNGALLFNNNNTQNVVVADSDSLDLTDKGSVVAWVKLTGYRDYAGIVHKGRSSSFSDSAYFLQMGGPISGMGNNKKVLIGGHDGVTDRFLVSNTELALETWYHLAYTWDSNGQKLYINGVLDVSNTNAVNVRVTTGSLQIGSQLTGQSNNYRFNGTIDNVSIHKRALSGNEIEFLYNE
jgi:hypothetical protein